MAHSISSGCGVGVVHLSLLAVHVYVWHCLLSAEDMHRTFIQQRHQHPEGALLIPLHDQQKHAGQEVQPLAVAHLRR
jgi:hypothetical protein